MIDGTTKLERWLSGAYPYIVSAVLLAALSCSQPAAAAPTPTPSNVVSICSGVRLPNSAVTAIVQPLTAATASLETTTNTILGTVAVLSGTPRVATNIASLMTSAGTGFTSVQAVSTDGTLIGASSSCYSSANGFTLATPAGIAVGGNAITGLGDSSKNAAVANELGAIAFGNGAVTATGATDAIAFGSGAQVTAAGASSVAIGAGAASQVANSVALGPGAIAQRGAVSGYSALGLSTLQSSVGEVSVGSSAGARQVTNVAAGSADTDAVNVAQLAGVSQSVATLSGLAVQYSSVSKRTIALGGASGTVITNLAAGSLASGSTDAVNGGQLSSTNAAVAANAGAVTSLGTTVAANTTAIAAANGAVATLGTNVASGGIGPVRFSDAANATTPNGGTPSQHLTLVGASAGAAGLHNVAAGTLLSASTDAINGAQLFATNAAVAANTSAVATLGTAVAANTAAIGTANSAIATIGTNVTNGNIGPVRFSDAANPAVPNGGIPSQHLALVGSGTGAVGLHNLAAGTLAAGSTDAVNGGQLFGTNIAVAANTSAITTLSGGLSVTQTQVAADRADVAANTSGIASLTTVSAANTTAIRDGSDALASLRSDVTNGRIGALQFAAAGSPTVSNGGTPSQDLALVGAGGGAVGLHNLAAGSATAGSTDAVNGGQLFATNTTVSGLSVRVDAIGPRFDADETTISGFGARLSLNEGDVATASVRLDLLTRGGAGPVRYADVVSPTTPNGGSVSQDLTLVGAALGPVSLHNVAAGSVSATSSDAVNGAQIYDANVSIAANTGAITTLGNGLASTDAQLGTVRDEVAANTADITTLRTSVAVDTAAIDQASDNLNGLRDDVADGRLGPVRFSDSSKPAVGNGGTPSQDLALVGASVGAVGLHNVAGGAIIAGSTDAVNGAQLFDTNAAVASVSGRVDSLSPRLDADDAAIAGLDGRVTTNEAGLVSANGNFDLLARGAAGPVRYADPSMPTTPNGGSISQDLTLIGATSGAVRLHNVAGGAVASSSTDAVNGGQLFDTNTAVNAVNDRVDAIGTSIAGNGVALAAIDARTTSNTTRIDNLSTSLGDVNAHIALLAAGGAGPVRYSSAASPAVPQAGPPTQDLTLVGGAAGPVGLHNVADGVIADGSTDAINGGELHAALASVGSAAALGVTYDDASRAGITLAGGGAAVTITNLAAGRLSATSADAVTGAQLYAATQNIADLGARADAVDAHLGTLDVGVQANTSDLSSLRSNLATFSSLVSNGGTGPLRYADASTPTTPNGGMPSQDLALVGVSSGAIGLHNLAPGAIAVGSTDAINGDQLYATNVAVTKLGSRVDGVETRVASEADALASLDARVTSRGAAVEDLSAQVGLLRNGGDGPVRYADAAFPTLPNGGRPSQHLTLVGSGAGPVTLHNLAAGSVSASSTDAVNGAQLYGLGQNVQALSAQVGTAVTYDATQTGVTLKSGNGAPVRVTNVAAGSVAAGSTDAVNGDQLNGLQQYLASTNSRVATVSDRIDAVAASVANDGTAISSLSARSEALASAVSNGAVGPLQYSSWAAPTTPNGGLPSSHVTLVGSGGGPVALHNLAPGATGAASLDAVNGAQLASLGSGVAAALGLSYDGPANALTGAFRFNGNDYSSVQSVLGVIEADMTSGPATTGKYFHANSIMSDSSAEGDDSTAIGPSSTSQGTASVAMGRSAAAMTDSAVAIGDHAKAMGGRAVSIGMGNTASGNGSVAIGDPNVATGDGAVALGKDNTATGLGAIAIGNVNTSSGQGAAAIGDANHVTGLGAVAIGSGNVISGEGSIALGLGNAVSGDRSLAIGSNVNNMAQNSLAIGDRAAARGDSSAAVGNSAVASGTLSGSFGVFATATKQYALALGPASAASAFASTALGTGAVSSAFASSALGTGSIAQHEGSVALGSASQTVRGPVVSYVAFGVSGSQSSAGEIAVARNIQYTDAESGQLTLIGNRQITGVAAGSADTDVTNVAQLRGAAAAIGAAAASALGGGATYVAATGTLSGPRYDVAGRSYASVGDALTALAASGSSAAGGGGSAPGTGAAALASVAGAENMVAFDDAGRGSVTLAQSGTVIRNVADGRVSAGSTDAVNGGQLSKVQDQVAALRNDVSGSAAAPLRYSTTAASTTPAVVRSNDVTLVGADAAAPVAVHNVAAGRIADASTDAVNGSQLAATDARVADAQDRAAAAQTAVQSSVRYDGPERSAVTLGDGSAPVAIHNVADGTSEHDAASLGQLASAAGAIMAHDQAYTDARISHLAFDLDKVRKDGNAGTAGALAMANMPQPYEAGRGMVAMAAGTFQGQSALAVGLSRAMADEHTIVKLGATYDTRGRVGAGAGVGYQF